jgi:hypothetical protein
MQWGGGRTTSLLCFFFTFDAPPFCLGLCVSFIGFSAHYVDRALPKEPRSPLSFLIRIDSRKVVVAVVPVIVATDLGLLAQPELRLGMHYEVLDDPGKSIGPEASRGSPRWGHFGEKEIKSCSDPASRSNLEPADGLHVAALISTAQNRLERI